MLTIGQRLPIIYNGRVYPLKVEDVDPSPVGHLIDTNLQVEFLPFDETADNFNAQDLKIDEKKNEIEDDDLNEILPMSLYTTTTNNAKFCYFIFN